MTNNLQHSCPCKRGTEGVVQQNNLQQALSLFLGSAEGVARKIICNEGVARSEAFFRAMPEALCEAVLCASTRSAVRSRLTRNTRIPTSTQCDASTATNRSYDMCISNTRHCARGSKGPLVQYPRTNSRKFQT